MSQLVEARRKKQIERHIGRMLPSSPAAVSASTAPAPNVGCTTSEFIDPRGNRYTRDFATGATWYGEDSDPTAASASSFLSSDWGRSGRLSPLKKGAGGAAAGATAMPLDSPMAAEAAGRSGSSMSSSSSSSSSGGGGLLASLDYDDLFRVMRLSAPGKHAGGRGSSSNSGSGGSGGSRSGGRSGGGDDLRVPSLVQMPMVCDMSKAELGQVTVLLKGLVEAASRELVNVLLHKDLLTDEIARRRQRAATVATEVSGSAGSASMEVGRFANK
eukprot:g6476.t1